MDASLQEINLDGTMETVDEDQFASAVDVDDLTLLRFEAPLKKIQLKEKQAKLQLKVSGTQGRGFEAECASAIGAPMMPMLSPS